MYAWGQYQMIKTFLNLTAKCLITTISNFVSMYDCSSRQNVWSCQKLVVYQYCVGMFMS